MYKGALSWIFSVSSFSPASLSAPTSCAIWTSRPRRLEEAQQETKRLEQERQLSEEDWRKRYGEAQQELDWAVKSEGVCPSCDNPYFVSRSYEKDKDCEEGMSDTKTERCPTCGAECTVAGTVTKWYVPVASDLKQQLAERDEALARCVEALTYYANSREIYSGDELWKYAEQVVTNITTSAQATAKVLAAARWIPCDEQMPDLIGRDDSHVPGGAPATLYSERVLVFNGTVRIDNLVQAEGSPETRTFYGSRKPVTHWMPLPEPPEAIREEQGGK